VINRKGRPCARWRVALTDAAAASADGARRGSPVRWGEIRRAPYRAAIDQGERGYWTPTSGAVVISSPCRGRFDPMSWRALRSSVKVGYRADERSPGQGHFRLGGERGLAGIEQATSPLSGQAAIGAFVLVKRCAADGETHTVPHLSHDHRPAAACGRSGLTFDLTPGRRSLFVWDFHDAARPPLANPCTKVDQAPPSPRRVAW
jgi:hypothetical protein